MKNYKKHIEWNYNEVKKHLNAYYESNDHEDLHKLRVHIKKIRSLVFWCKLEDHNKVKVALKKLKILYNEAGKIRSGFIFTKLMTQYDIKAKQLIHEEIKKTKLNTRLFDLHYWLYTKEIDISLDKIQKLISEPKSQHITKNIKRTVKSIKQKLVDDKTTENWHEARKEVKTIIYNLEITGKGVLSEKFNHGYLQNIQHQLGEWHDIVVTEDILKNYMSNSDKRLNRLKSKKENVENDIFNTVKNFETKLFLKN